MLGLVSMASPSHAALSVAGDVTSVQAAVAASIASGTASVAVDVLDDFVTGTRL